MEGPDGGNEQENLGVRYCELTDTEIDSAHPYFHFNAEMKLAMASMGLAVSSGIRLQATREILDMLDTLYQNLSEPGSVLPDNQRKQLNHAGEVWLDMKDKMSKGDLRASYLLSAHAHIENSLLYLMECRKDSLFKDLISDYLPKYLGKLSVFVYREAIGHVML